MKYFSLKVWSLTSFFLALGLSSLWVMVRLLDSLVHSSNEVVVWFLASAGCLKRAFLSLCTIVIAIYLVRLARAAALWLESKSRKELL